MIESNSSSQLVRWQWLAAVVLLAACVLLFARLGHYSLWDDEAITAMTSRGVWRTGDTSALVDGHNILGYRNGLLLRGFFDRYTPPLQFYLIALFIGSLGQTNFDCRLPIALCGVACVAIMLRWLGRHDRRPATLGLFALVLLANASFFLFFRQCRYYGLTTLATVGVAYCYLHWDGRRRSLPWLVAWSIILLTSNYLDYAAAYIAIAVDHFLWRRHQRKLDVADWLTILLPQLVIGVLVLRVWNPLSAEGGHYFAPELLACRARLVYYSFRDIIACEFGAPALLLMSPIVLLFTRDRALLRAIVAAVVYVLAVTAVVPIRDPTFLRAEVRYLAPVIPLCIAIGLLALRSMAVPRKVAAYDAATSNNATGDGSPSVAAAQSPATCRRTRRAVLALACVSTFLPATRDARWTVKPTFAYFYRELLHPVKTDPYAPASYWVCQHVPAGASVWVQPDWMVYPLMWYAPDPLYAWQFTDPPKPEYATLPAAHFAERTAPDFIIQFGPWKDAQVNDAMTRLAVRGFTYTLVDTIKVHWQDRYRPELIWRDFYDRTPGPGEAVYCYRRD